MRKINFSFIFILILILGLFLRLINLNQSLWLDEAISVMAVKEFNFSDLLTKYMILDFNPPLFNIILFFWLKIFPASEIIVRLPSLILGLLTCILVYKIYKLFFKKTKGANIAMLLLATSPLHIYYSQEARMYSLAAFSTTLAIYFFLKLNKEREISLKNLIFSSLSLSLALYSHYLCWLILPFLSFYIFLPLFKKEKSIEDNKKNFYQCQKIFFALFFAFLSQLPWLPYFFKQLVTGQRAAELSPIWSQTVGALSLKAVILLPVKFIIGRTNFANFYFYVLIVFLIGILFFYFLLKAFKKEAGFFILWLVSPILLALFISLKIPVFSYFRFLFLLPSFYILLAFGVSQHQKTILAVILILMSNLFFSFRYLFNSEFQRENWKEAIAFLHQLNENQKPVLLFEAASAPFLYYDEGESEYFFISKKEVIKNWDSFWYIPYLQPIFDPQDNYRIFFEKKGFFRTFEKHFRGITLEKWEKIRV